MRAVPNFKQKTANLSFKLHWEIPVLVAVWCNINKTCANLCIPIYMHVYVMRTILCATQSNVKAIEDWIVDLLVYVLKGRFYGV